MQFPLLSCIAGSIPRHWKCRAQAPDELPASASELNRPSGPPISAAWMALQRQAMAVRSPTWCFGRDAESNPWGPPDAGVGIGTRKASDVQCTIASHAIHCTHKKREAQRIEKQK